VELGAALLKIFSSFSIAILCGAFFPAAGATSIQFQGFPLPLTKLYYGNMAKAPVRLTADLSTLSWPLNEIAPVLLEGVRASDDWETQVAALTGLVLMGPETLPAAFEALDGKSGERFHVVDAALTSLHRMEKGRGDGTPLTADERLQRGRALLPVFEAAIAGEEVLGRALAAYHISGLGLPAEELWPALQQALADRDALVIATALHVIAHLRELEKSHYQSRIPDSAIQRLIEQSSWLSAEWQERVVVMLAREGPWIQPVLARLNEVSTEEAAECRALLEAIGERRARTTSPEPGLSTTADAYAHVREALQRQDPVLERLLFEDLDLLPQRVQEYAPQILACSTRMASQEMMRLLLQPGFDGGAVVPDLLRVLEAPRYELREVALEVLGKTVPNDQRVTEALLARYAVDEGRRFDLVPQLAARASRNAADARLLEEAYTASLDVPVPVPRDRLPMDSLCTLADAVAVAGMVDHRLLLEGLSAGPAYHRWAAARALCRVAGEVEAAALLVPLLDDWNSPVVEMAARALDLGAPEDACVSEMLLDRCEYREPKFWRGYLEMLSRRPLNQAQRRRLSRVVFDQVVEYYATEPEAHCLLSGPEEAPLSPMVPPRAIDSYCDLLSTLDSMGTHFFQILLQSTVLAAREDAIQCLDWSGVDATPFLPTLEYLLQKGNAPEQTSRLLCKAGVPADYLASILVGQLQDRGESAEEAAEALVDLGVATESVVSAIIVSFGLDQAPTNFEEIARYRVGLEKLVRIGAEDPLAVSTVLKSISNGPHRTHAYSMLTELVKHHVRKRYAVL
jgi:hypothetical protein